MACELTGLFFSGSKTWREAKRSWDGAVKSKNKKMSYFNASREGKERVYVGQFKLGAGNSSAGMKLLALAVYIVATVPGGEKIS